MRARRQSGDFIRGSTFQYLAAALLYRDDGPWQGMDLGAVRTRIGQLLPAELRRAWLLLHRCPRGMTSAKRNGRRSGSDGLEPSMAFVPRTWVSEAA